MTVVVALRIPRPPAANGRAIFAALATALVVLAAATAWADPVSGNFTNAAALILVAAAALVTKAETTDWLVMAPLLVCAWGLGQLALQITIYPFATWNAVTDWLVRAGIFQLAFVTLAVPLVRRRVLTVLVVFGAVMSLVGLLQWFTSGGSVLWFIPTQYQNEVIGTFLNRDQYAVFAELLLPITLARALLSRRARWAYIGISGFQYASVLASGSRAGAVLVSAEVLIFIVIALRRRTSSYRVIAGLAAALVICTAVGGWDYIWARFQAPNPFAWRREMLAASLGMIKARPLAGFGLGAWPTAYPGFAVFDPPGVFMNHAHNDWAEWTADGGIPLTLIVLALFAGAIRLVRRVPWVLGVPIMLVHAAVDFPMQKTTIGVLAFFLLGAAAAQNKSESEPAKSALPRRE